MRETEPSQLVRCEYKGEIIGLTPRIIAEAITGESYDRKLYVRYKEGAKMFSMSEREFYKLAHVAGAVIKYKKMCLVKIEIVDKYLQYFREES